MNSTRLLLVTVLSIAVLLVVGALVWSTVYGDEFSNGLATSRAPTQHIIVITARSVEPGCGLRQRNSTSQGIR